ncbi:FAD-dependent oxidoreductase [uncultured Sulfitobacter sp.]|uniref:FAD-dependent oxidoreductase n=1 Tax=uncultured Sulfitobacter sp. TaxID=191468 RepID=UPI002605AEC2|nr:FAD-dependent oxidoreductase [uncultured Sulfitobacter sp.]
MSGLQRASLDTLTARPYDVLVVGGGIYGAMAAREAGLRGYRTALVERDDFGAGTSFNSLKIMHGGIRYVQHLDVLRLRASARERAFWRHAAPDLVAPLDFIIPLTGYGINGPIAFGAAAALYTGLSAGRRGPDFGGAGVIGPAAARAHLGALAPAGLTGGGVWRDGQIRDVGRLQISVLSAAAAHGVDIANYMAVDGFVRCDGRVEGATVTDRRGGQSGEIAARVVLSCTGEAARSLAAPVVSTEARGRFPTFARALNIVVDRQIGDRALGLTGFERSDAVVDRGGRMYFLTPWAGLTVIGTHEAPQRGQTPDTAVTDFLDILNRACPDLALDLGDVLHVYDGVIPADVDDDRTRTVHRQTAGTFLDHASDGAAGLISVIGVKYTTARAIAVRAMDIAETHLGGGASAGARQQSLTEKLPPVASAAVDPDDTVALAARMEHAMRHEMAMTLNDVIMRRMPLVETGALSGPVGQTRHADLRRIARRLGLPDESSMI